MAYEVQDLVNRLKWDGAALSSEEVDWVACRLLNSPSSLEVSNGLYILAIEKAFRHRAVMDEFLFSKNVVFVERALSMVWRYWKDYDRYRQFTLELIKGVVWDEVERVRATAITVVGGYLRESVDVELVCEIFQAYLASDSRLVQVAAYRVLSSLLSISPEELEGPPRKPIVRPEVVDRIEEFVKSLKNGDDVL
ncbi:hypothetical protein FRC91_05075 [Bradymonadales bacterium TMQ1]|uniref:HEAT repeat domain-containing protein n=1 Tax=Lujinxingia sediminis TaxID=2480984 RepID=A0ABY0CYR5_9DELT|nr:hypothetical protein [Lujinxingia sediminis]RVU48808.1 hypothetical protein EA187_05110 [Lujinxingia sediminis]TXC78101.1 hypothetical protein FRC91_05075 [Bradymonadales bacterium TMQ1]